MSNYNKTQVEAVYFNQEKVEVLRDLSIHYEGAVVNPYGNNLLSSHAYFTTSEAVQWSYKVLGKYEDVSFTYGTEDYEISPVIPIIGLYATRPTTVEMTLKTMAGNVFLFRVIYQDVSDQDFSEHLLSVNVEIMNEEIAEKTIASGWVFVGGFMDAYDKYGDIRVCGLSDDPYLPQPLRVHAGELYVAGENQYYISNYKTMKLIGKKAEGLTAPEGEYFHHDLDWDQDGYIYCLGTITDEGTVEKKKEAAVYKYNAETKELVKKVDYSKVYYDSSVLKDSEPNDVHFNTIEYVEEIDQVVINCRSTSNYIGLDKNTLEPLWNVDNPARKLVFDETMNLTVVNPEEFIYPNGEHSTLPTYNKAYQKYWDEGKVVLSIFDNVACKDEDGFDIEEPCETVEQDEAAGYEWDSAVQVVVIDLEAKTVEQLKRFTIPGERSQVTSNVMDIGDNEYYQIYYGVPADFFITDINGSVAVAIKGIKPEGVIRTYRGRIFSYDEMRELVGR